jgi:hypothetical protein
LTSAPGRRDATPLLLAATAGLSMLGERHAAAREPGPADQHAERIRA